MICSCPKLLQLLEVGQYQRHLIGSTFGLIIYAICSVPRASVRIKNGKLSSNFIIVEFECFNFYQNTQPHPVNFRHLNFPKQVYLLIVSFQIYLIRMKKTDKSNQKSQKGSKEAPKPIPEVQPKIKPQREEEPPRPVDPSKPGLYSFKGPISQYIKNNLDKTIPSPNGNKCVETQIQQAGSFTTVEEEVMFNKKVTSLLNINEQSELSSSCVPERETLVQQLAFLNEQTPKERAIEAGLEPASQSNHSEMFSNFVFNDQQIKERMKESNNPLDEDQMQQLTGVKPEIKDEMSILNGGGKTSFVEFIVTVEESGQRFKTSLQSQNQQYHSLGDVIRYICMHLRVTDPDSLMMIRDRKPRYLVSELDEIENGESYVLVRKGTPAPAPSVPSLPLPKRANKPGPKKRQMNQTTYEKPVINNPGKMLRNSLLESSRGICQSSSGFGFSTASALSPSTTFSHLPTLSSNQSSLYSQTSIDQNLFQKTRDEIEKLQMGQNRITNLINRPDYTTGNIFSNPQHLNSLFNPHTSTFSFQVPSLGGSLGSQSSLYGGDYGENISSEPLMDQMVYPTAYFKRHPFQIQRQPYRRFPPLPDENNEISLQNAYESVIVDMEDPNAPQFIYEPNSYTDSADWMVTDKQVMNEYNEIHSQIQNILKKPNSSDGFGFGSGKVTIDQMMSVENPESVQLRASGNIFSQSAQNELLDLEEKNDETREDAQKRFLTNFFGPEKSGSFHEGRYIPPYSSGRQSAADQQALLTQSEMAYEALYTRTVKLDGFIKWQEWVPMPFPHKEITYAKGMYERGETLMVQTPDFVDFANEFQNITSRNDLIFKMKRMMLNRGMRANLQMSSTGEVKSIIVVVMCSRNGKACTKNPSIKNNCPFIMYYIRKSALFDRSTNQMQDNFNLSVGTRASSKRKTPLPLIGSYSDLRNFKGKDDQGLLYREIFDDDGIEEIDEDDPQGDTPFNIKRTGTNLNTRNRVVKSKFSKLLEDIDIDTDPFYLQKYRSFHNHALDCNLMEHNALIMEKDIHRKGACNILPQGPVAIQDLCGRRRREIKEEIQRLRMRQSLQVSNKLEPSSSLNVQIKENSSNPQNSLTGLSSCVDSSSLQVQNEGSDVEWYMRYNENEFLPFQQLEKTTTLYSCDEEFDQIAQYRVIEPMGMAPQLLVVENLNDEEGIEGLDADILALDKDFKDDKLQWPPSESSVKFYRDRVITSFSLVLTQVALKLNNCDYNLDKWRRILPNMKPKVFYKPPEYYEAKAAQLAKQQAAQRKRNQDNLIKIVSKLSKDSASLDRHQRGLINSDDESSSVYIDPSVHDPHYKPKSAFASAASKEACAAPSSSKSIFGIGEDEMSSYSVYNK